MGQEEKRGISNNHNNNNTGKKGEGERDRESGRGTENMGQNVVMTQSENKLELEKGETGIAKEAEREGGGEAGESMANEKLIVA